ncbi:hypothetical protein [Ruegeria meonggei]|uniref:Uncharacterized protein n=1 Tax=Ruegeria meonggei TaxID=1446476 RepID=A0A1X7ACJ3_9RHOB|nr:hypothetical protein [Ruegeria meonggei]SLN75833.1 hypothetical protein RUM8411_04273 [Ruegeria meonggei]
MSVETGVTGVIVEAKEALVNSDDPRSKSCYVDIKIDGKDEPQQLWGTALQDLAGDNPISAKTPLAGSQFETAEGEITQGSSGGVPLGVTREQPQYI